MTDDHASALLRQIAADLGMPVSVLLDHATPPPIGPTAQAILDTVELVRAFEQITDPATRRDCIEFVRKAGLA